MSNTTLENKLEQGQGVIASKTTTTPNTTEKTKTIPITIILRTTTMS